jgi:hypothetical protein
MAESTPLGWLCRDPVDVNAVGFTDSSPLRRSSRETVEVPRAFKLPRYGVLGCLDLRSFSLGRVTAYPWKWRRGIAVSSEGKLEPPCADGPPEEKSALRGSGK